MSAFRGDAQATVRPASAAHLSPLRFRSIACTHPGCVRQLNEDACLDRPDIGLWAVADGMGGHDAGDQASQSVIKSLSHISDFNSAFAFRRAVRVALLSVNDDLRRKAEEELLGAIGSTVVALLAHGGHYACIWAGDSRAYLHRNGKLDRVTRDHSLVQQLVDSGQLTREHAKSHSDGHVITRAVGASERLDLDGVYGEIRRGDRFLLCSDGLAAVFSDEELAAYLRTGLLASIAAALMKEALGRGAPDNVTFILVEAEGLL